jgi:hypothetical protein
VTSQQIQQIIDTLKGATGQGFGALTKQSMVDGWVMLGFAIALGAILLAALAVCIATSLHAGPRHEVASAWAICTGFIAAGCFVAVAILVGIGLPQVLNPAGSALNGLIGH